MTTEREPIKSNVRRARLTKTTIDALAPGADRYMVWDSDLKGFGVRVEPSGRKAYYVR